MSAFVPKFYANQILGGTNIIDVFAAGDIKYAIAWAEVQSGKTGTYQYIAREMMRRGIIQRAYILCGSNETILRDQCIEDTLNYNGDNYVVDKDTGVQHGRFCVLFRQDFKDAHMDITNALIVVDESHLDQTQGQEMDKFLSRYGLGLDGTRACMNEYNTYILSVDATPYSEISAHLNKKSHPKHLERIEPGSGYFGIQDFIFTRRIHKTWDFTTVLGERLFGEMIDTQTRKWILIRINGKKDSKLSVLNRLCAARGFRILHFNSTKTEIAIRRIDNPELPCLEDQPDVTTIVVIQGRLRAGKVVPKEHIGYVWEDAKTSKTDSIVQGLLGRMCGYYADGAYKPMIFLPSATLKENEDRVIKGNELRRHIMSPIMLPTKGMNLVPGRIAKAASHGRTQCPPFLLTPEMFAENIDHFVSDPARGEARSESLIKQLCLETLCANLDTVLAQHADTLSLAQSDEIRIRLETLTAGATHIRNFQGVSQASYYKELRTAFVNHTVPSENMTDSPYLTFCVTYSNYTAPHAVCGQVYCVMYTDASGWMTAVHKDSRIPADSGKSVFTIHDTGIRDRAAAVGALAMPLEALRSPANLETYLQHHIRIWSEPIGDALAPIVDPCINAYEDRFVFSKRTFNYTSTRANDIQRMIPRLNERFGIHLKVTYCRPGALHFGVKKIEWTRA